MQYIIAGKDNDGNVFVDDNPDEQDQKNLLEVLRAQGWQLSLYGYSGQWSDDERSMIRSLLMASHPVARQQLRQLGIKPIN